MKKTISRTEAKEKIDTFFKRENFSAEETKKTKRLAMKFNIELGNYRKNFCKKCFSKLEGKTRVSREHKIVECSSCGFKNKLKLRSK